MLIMLKTHKHIHDVTNMLILLTVFFWIKLLLKLPNILTIQKRDRQFSVVGFASMLKSKSLRALITRGGGRGAFYGCR